MHYNMKQKKQSETNKYSNADEITAIKAKKQELRNFNIQNMNGQYLSERTHLVVVQLAQNACRVIGARGEGEGCGGRCLCGVPENILSTSPLLPHRVRDIDRKKNLPRCCFEHSIRQRIFRFNLNFLFHCLLLRLCMCVVFVLSCLYTAITLTVTISTILISPLTLTLTPHPAHTHTPKGCRHPIPGHVLLRTHRRRSTQHQRIPQKREGQLM